MPLSDSIEAAKELALKHQGDPDKFYAALSSKLGNKVGTFLSDRIKTAVRGGSPELSGADEIAAILKKPKAAAGTPPTTPAPKPSPGTAAAQGTPEPSNAELIGRTVINAITSPDPKVSNLMTKALVTATVSNRVMLRSGFDSMTSDLKNQFMRAGGKLTADSAKANITAEVFISLTGKATPTKTRAQFDALSQKERGAFMAAGGKLTK